MEFTITNNGEKIYNEMKALLCERLKHDVVRYETLSIQLEDYYKKYQETNNSLEWLQNLQFLQTKWLDSLPPKQKPIAFYQPRLTNISNTENLKTFLKKDLT